MEFMLGLEGRLGFYVCEIMYRDMLGYMMVGLGNMGLCQGRLKVGYVVDKVSINEMINMRFLMNFKGYLICFLGWLEELSRL